MRQTLNKDGYMELLTLEEAAQIMKVSVQTVRRMVTSGEIPSVKIRGQYRIRKVDLEAYINKQL
jgi:excisionase family DNA binding protein